MVEKVFVGIDTSNYTTSVAICDYFGNIIKNFKLLLPVKKGERGLRQSDTIFFHIKNLSKIAEKIKTEYEKYEIIAMGHSAFPRDVVDSYMPCFLVGKALSDILSALYHIDNFSFSHQAGHIMASLYSSKLQEDDFIAFHVSGGTTEILKVKCINGEIKVDLIGGSKDLHAGQAIDRIGVKLGLGFPCGAKLEELANKNTEAIPKFKVSVKGYFCNLSGLENLALDLIKKTDDLNLVSAFTLEFIYKTIEKLTSNIRSNFPNKPIVYAGGVMSNSIISTKLKNNFSNIYFAAPEFSSDNASGIALLTRLKFLSKED